MRILPVTSHHCHRNTEHKPTHGLVAWPSRLRRSSDEWSCSTLSPVSTGMGDRFRIGIPPRYVTKPTWSTQPCIPPGLINRVPAFFNWLEIKAGMSPLPGSR